MSTQELKPLQQVELGNALCKVAVRGRFLDKDAADYTPSPESDSLRFELPEYDGPLDLLLHLIRKHSIDIFDIPIVIITQKYLEAIAPMRHLDLDIAGDFLLMAATLTQIKSKMLLPPDPVEEADESEGVDPREELVKRLLEYQAFKDVAAQFSERACLGYDVFKRANDEVVVDDSWTNEALPIREIEGFKLAQILAKALQSNTAVGSHRVQFESISVRARVRDLIDFCHYRSRFGFNDVLRFFDAVRPLDEIS